MMTEREIKIAEWMAIKDDLERAHTKMPIAGLSGTALEICTRQCIFSLRTEIMKLQLSRLVTFQEAAAGVKLQAYEGGANANG